MTTVTMIDDRVAIRAQDGVENNLQKSKGGIYIPADSRFNKFMMGEVIHAGAGRYENGVFIAPQVKKGDKVLFEKQTRPEFPIDGEILMMMKERDIIAVLKQEAEPATSIQEYIEEQQAKIETPSPESVPEQEPDPANGTEVVNQKPDELTDHATA